MADEVKMITITSKINVKGYGFSPQQQYCYESIQQIAVGCGCGGKKKEIIDHYRVLLNGIYYDIPSTHAVKTTIPIDCKDQNFSERIAFVGDTQSVQDFNEFRRNNDPMAIAIMANNIPM